MNRKPSIHIINHPIWPRIIYEFYGTKVRLKREALIELERLELRLIVKGVLKESFLWAESGFMILKSEFLEKVKKEIERIVLNPNNWEQRQEFNKRKKKKK
jgi:hypothetical protein